MGSVVTRSALCFMLATILGCGPREEVRYLLVPSFGVVEQISASESIVFLLAVESAEPVYVPGNMQYRLLIPFHFILDWWDPTTSSFRPIGPAGSPRPIDHGPQVIQVSKEAVMMRIDLAKFYDEIGKMIKSDEIRCRIRLPLCSYDVKRRHFEYRKSAQSESFILVIEGGAAVGMRRDRTPEDSPGGLSIDTAQDLMGFSIDYDTIDRGMQSHSPNPSP